MNKDQRGLFGGGIPKLMACQNRFLHLNPGTSLTSSLLSNVRIASTHVHVHIHTNTRCLSLGFPTAFVLVEYFFFPS